MKSDSPMQDAELTGANSKLGNAASQWAGLHKMIAKADCPNFMFMGERAQKDRFINLYKHHDTRRYLNVDQLGQCYRYNATTNEYEPISANEALKYVLS